MKKRFLSCGVVVVFIIIILFIPYQFSTKNDYTLGKTPFSSLLTFSGNKLIFKDDVKIGDSYEFYGLYLKDLNSRNDKKEILLADNCRSSINVYQNNVYYIDIEYNINVINLDSLQNKLFVSSNGHPLFDSLLIDDVMYYIQELEDGKSSLFSINVNEQHPKEIVTDINPQYLYNYCGKIGVQLQNSQKLLFFDSIGNIIDEQNDFKFEVQGFLEDGSIIYNMDQKIYRTENFESGIGELLFDNKDIYRTIVNSNEIMFITLNDHQLIQVYTYNLSNKTCEKLANANYIPRDFDKKYIACCSDSGLGSLELIDRSTGEIFTFSRK